MILIETPGFKLACYVKGEADASKLALVLPGLLDTKDYPHMITHVDFLAKQGYLAVTFDPPGTWESHGDIEIYTMSNYLKAVDELIQHFSSKPTFVMGHSLGGSIAMLSAVKNTGIVAIAAIMSASSFVRDSNREERIIKWRNDKIKVSYRNMPEDSTQRKQFDLPYSFSEDAQQYDVSQDLKTLQIPKLFIAGDQDTSVEPELVSQTYSLAAKPKILHIMKSDHNYRDHPELINEVNEYIQQVL
jgi:pimeloyl-ACP methyl ester carboxylesterase